MQFTFKSFRINVHMCGGGRAQASDKVYGVKR